MTTRGHLSRSISPGFDGRGCPAERPATPVARLLPGDRAAVGAADRSLGPVIIEPRRGREALDLRELWRYRELLYFLTWRDLKVRYKQTLLGLGWAVLVPLFQMVVFTLFFNHVAKVGSQGLPYPLFSYAALVPWYLFANSVQLSSQSLVAGSNLITKVYFPRSLLVLSPLTD